LISLDEDQNQANGESVLSGVSRPSHNPVLLVADFSDDDVSCRAWKNRSDLIQDFLKKFYQKSVQFVPKDNLYFRNDQKNDKFPFLEKEQQVAQVTKITDAARIMYKKGIRVLPFFSKRGS
jgi:hypothetical protein